MVYIAWQIGRGFHLGRLTFESGLELREEIGSELNVYGIYRKEKKVGVIFTSRDKFDERNLLAIDQTVIPPKTLYEIKNDPELHCGMQVEVLPSEDTVADVLNKIDEEIEERWLERKIGTPESDTSKGKA